MEVDAQPIFDSESEESYILLARKFIVYYPGLLITNPFVSNPWLAPFLLGALEGDLSTP